MRYISVLFLFALASCDTAAPAEPIPAEPIPAEPIPAEPIPAEPIPAVRLVDPLPDLNLDLTDEGRSIQLDAHFEGNEVSGDIAFAVSVVNGRGSALDVDGAVLSARPVAEGRSEVRVEARGERGGVAVDTFAVVVTDPCPASPPDGTSVVFSVSVGQRWVYARSSSHHRTGDSYYYRSSGRVDVEVVAAGRCAEDAQMFVVREQRTDTTERWRGDGSDWEPAGAPTTTVRTYTWAVSDSLVRTDAPDLPGRPGGGLAPPPFGREAPRYVLTSDLRPDGSTSLGGYPFGPFVILADRVGPVRYSTTTVFGTAGHAGEEWVIAE